MKALILSLYLFPAALLAGEFCYLPTESNVSYSSVTELPVGSPAEVLSYGSDALQFGELWLPADAGRAAPLVVMIHGGCWLNAFDIKHTQALSTALAHSGYAVWSVEYRRTGDEGGGWPGSFEDVLSAVRFAAAMKNPLVDNSSPALIGHSAGGHLALLAGSELADDDAVSLAGVVGLAPIVDIVSYALGDNSCQVAGPKFMGGSPSELPQAYALANPAARELHSGSVSIHGDQDSIVPLVQSTSSDLPVRVIEGAGHFDMVHPGTPAFKALLKELAMVFAGAENE